MKKLVSMLLFLIIVLGIAACAGQKALETPATTGIKIQPFVFIDRFPAELGPLGFPTGNVMQLGAFVTSGDSPVAEVTAKNLDGELVVELTSLKVGTIYTTLLYILSPMPPFDPSKHLGVWEIKAKDEKGNEAVVRSHRLDTVGEMPYVSNIKASGNPLAPTISWSPPKEGEYPPKCKIGYQVRLFKDSRSQFYKTKEVIYDLKDEIPEGVLKAEDIPDTYVRVECQCWDTNEMDQPLPLELRSETCRPLKEALGQ